MSHKYLSLQVNVYKYLSTSKRPRKQMTARKQHKQMSCQQITPRPFSWIQGLQEFSMNFFSMKENFRKKIEWKQIPWKEFSMIKKIPGKILISWKGKFHEKNFPWKKNPWQKISGKEVSMKENSLLENSMMESFE